MNKEEAEQYIYQSYLRAERYQSFATKDADKRKPELTREIIEKKAKTPCAVVTGSKGKGSVANMISQLLRTNYKVGLMTSPHLIDFCERFRVDGRQISDEDFIRILSDCREELDAIDRTLPLDVCISPMGIQADLALTYFNEKQTDFNVFECGKGAKYDDVNNIPHEYAVINRIFLEHTRELGETLSQIAADKAHVITGEQKCVYVADQQPEAMQQILDRAQSLHVPLKIYGRDFVAEKLHYSNNGMQFDVVTDKNRYENIVIPILGDFQARNCALALALCEDVLPEMDLDRQKEQLLQLKWPGRMEILSKDPLILLDACVNPASCDEVCKVLGNLGVERITLVVGIPDDKDYVGVIQKMRHLTGQLILTKSQSPHYRFTPKQCDVLRRQGMSALWTDSVDEALQAAGRLSNPIVILATTSVVSEIEEYKEHFL